MGYWWEGDPDERYWVEIRKAPGTGTELRCPEFDQDGGTDPWYELVSSVRREDLVYHWHASEHRFVGRSVASADADLSLTDGESAYVVPLDDFQPFDEAIALAEIRALADDLYQIRDHLETSYGRPLYLPFQFTKKRARLSFMSNYFAKLPSTMVETIFGNATTNGAPRRSPAGQRSARSFLKPFTEKADTKYRAMITRRTQIRSRDHETLVNDCASWLRRRGYEPGRNAAVDLGLEDPAVIFEAKIVGTTWATVIRQAVGQLYEYRYFKVANPSSKLIFLVDKPVPDDWITYLESDRGIGVMYPGGSTFKMSALAKKALRA